jgi:hypothetical protein
MNYILKSCSMTDIRNKMLLIYFLNITDIIFTLLLCGTGLFVEANPLVGMFAADSLAAVLTKSIVPAFLLAFLYLRMKKATGSQLKKVNKAVVILLFFYAVINISHIIWLTVCVFNPYISGIALL